tara:strand:- start:795 stop:1220 length:426 start_codon:yes stop_codon:yes gene_type:complete
MESIFNYIDNLILIAVIILAIYLFVSLFFSNGYTLAIAWFKNLFKSPELFVVLIFQIILFYPFIFIGFLRDWFEKNQSTSEEGFSIIGETIKALHQEFDIKGQVDEVNLLGWKHLLGFHLPILLLWIAMWLSIIKAVMVIF